jgi:hypothetical protein
MAHKSFKAQKAYLSKRGWSFTPALGLATKKDKLTGARVLFRNKPKKNTKGKSKKDDSIDVTTAPPRDFGISYNKWWPDHRIEPPKSMPKTKINTSPKPSLMRIGEEFSHTSTVKGKPGKVINNFSSGTISTSKYECERKHRKPTFDLKQAQKLEFITQNGYSLSSLTNTQGFNDMTLSQLQINTGSNVAKPNALAIMSGNYAATTYGSVYTVASMGYNNAGSNKTSKVYFDYVTVDTMLSNRSATPVVVTLYEVIAKRDYSGLPAGAPSIYTASEYCTSPCAYVNTSFGANSTPANTTAMNNPGALNFISLDAKPTQAPLFNLYWKITGVFNITLGVGCSHKHTSFYKYAQSIDQLLYSSQALLGGITRNIMLTCQGVPGADSKTTSAAFGDFVISTAFVGVTHEITYKAYEYAYSETITYTDYIPAGTGDTVTVIDVNDPSLNTV